MSEIQDREPDPEIHTLANLTWKEGSIPQVAQPFTRDGRDYVLQVDEFSRYGVNHGSVQPKDAVVGAARIIDVTDLRHPVVVSHLRLGVQQPAGADPLDRRPGRQHAARRLHRPLLLGALPALAAPRRPAR